MIRKLYAQELELLSDDGTHAEVCVLVNGVGYGVTMTSRAYKDISEDLETGEVSNYPIHTHHRLTETAEVLYGFSEKREYELFNMFLEVQGVGAKTGLSLVQTLTLQEVKKAVRNSDLSCFKSVSGVGPSTSKKILESLKSQFKIK